MPKITKNPPAQVINITPAQQEQPAPANEEKRRDELSPSWFWDLINGISKDDWGSKYDLLLLRRGESKVPMATGEKGFLDQFIQPVSLPIIKQKYGGGLFRIILNHNGHFKTSHDFEIEGQPLYDSRRERPVNAPAAAGGSDSALAQQIVTMLREEMSRNREAQGNNPASEAAIGLVTNGAAKVIDMIKENSTGKSGGILETITVLKELGLIGQQQQPAGGGVVETIKVLKELGLIGTAPAAAAGNLTDQLTQLLTVYEKLDAVRGSGGGGKADWKETLASKAMEHLPEVVSVFRETRDSNVERAKAERERAVAQRQTAEVLRTISPAASSAATSPHAAPQGVELTHSAPVSAMRTVRLDGAASEQDLAAAAEVIAAAPAAFTEADPGFVAWLKHRLVALVCMGQSGESIVDFLDGAAPGYSDQLNSAPAAMVTAFMRNDPILRAATEHPRWETTLAEARDYLKDGAEADAAAAPVLQ